MDEPEVTAGVGVAPGEPPAAWCPAAKESPPARHHYRVISPQYVSAAVRAAAERALVWAGEVTGRNTSGYSIEFFTGIYHPAAIRDLEEHVILEDPEGVHAFARANDVQGLHRFAAPKVLRIRASSSPRRAASVCVHELVHALQAEEHPGVYTFLEAEPALERHAHALEALLEKSEFFQGLPDDHERAVDADRVRKLRDLAAGVLRDVDDGLRALERAHEVLEALREAPAELLEKAGVDLTFGGDDALVALLEAAAEYTERRTKEATHDHEEGPSTTAGE